MRKLLILLALLAITGALHAQPVGGPQPQARSTPAPAAPADAAPAQAVTSAAKPAAPPLPLSEVLPERDMSPWTMFMSADILVKAVMISLTFASFITWTIFFAKTIQLALARRRLNTALALISECRTLSQAQAALATEGDSVLSVFLNAAIHEWKLSANSRDEVGIKERAASNLVELMRAEARHIRVGMAVLATIGSTSPFVGLFGTVWGIMNSFIGISKAQTTNLAVVAPGIAEALLATAIGLVAAIPAVMIYNHFSRVTKGYVDLASRGAGEVNRLLSRDLDQTRGRVVAHAAE